MQLYAMKTTTARRDQDKQWLLEHALGQDTAQRVERTPEGKPFAAGGPFFSLSHSGEWLVLGTHDRDIGVDIEIHKPGRPFQGLSRRLHFQGDSTPTAFYDQWTAKESQGKLAGTGIFAPVPPSEVRNYQDLPGYSVAVAVRGRERRWAPALTVVRRS
jgi:phosphopantetheinyl transferase